MKKKEGNQNSLHDFSDASPHRTGKRWIGCPIEDEHIRENRKEGKAERRRLEKKDRSKFKKTQKQADPSQVHQNIKKSKESFLQGRVLSITPQGYLVQSEDGKVVTCALRGVLKKEKTLYKNLVTVGDLVLFEKSSSSEGLIAHVEPRKTVLSRADNLSRRKEQLIAANVDQVIITSSVVSPTLKPPLIDRYIIAAEKGDLIPIIVINKVDLLTEFKEEADLLEECKKSYEKAGIPLIAVSLVTQEGIQQLRDAMEGKTSVFSGQSGVGKTSLINAITERSLPIGSVVDKTNKGSHTTTTAQLIPLPFGGWCVDTPGIKSFGIWDLDIQELFYYYPEFMEEARKCKYPNCTHTQEEGCAIIQAVESETLSLIRYESYLALFEDLKATHKRR